MTVLNPRVWRWFEGRKISREALEEASVYSGRWVRNELGDAVIVPAPDGDVIVFPYLEGGREVAAKYRGAGKRFSQRAGGKKTFFNADILDDVALADGTALVITEGELDCLAVLTCGYRFSVSVPDGAPPARDRNGILIKVPEDSSDIDPEHDDKYAYILNNWERLARVKRIVVATDGDEAGRRLAQELVRRLDRLRCYFVEYPIDEVVPLDDGGFRACKDLNEVLIYLGQAAVMEVIAGAKPYPVSGVYTIDDLPNTPPLQTFTTGFPALDDHLRPHFPGLMVVTGAANQGKSTWTMQLVSHFAMNQGYKIGVCSLEMEVRPFVAEALMAPLIRKPRDDWDEDDIAKGNAFLLEHFCFIAPDPEDEAPHDIDWLLERAKIAVIRHGMRVFLFDPWNDVDHNRDPRETQTEYVGRMLVKIKRFMRRYGVLVIIVAHPTKAGAAKGPSEVGLYDISDSAHFANKADFGIVVSRKPESMSQMSVINVVKVRYQRLSGVPGVVEMPYNVSKIIYEPRDAEPYRSPYEPRQPPKRVLPTSLPSDLEDAPF